MINNNFEQDFERCAVNTQIKMARRMLEIR